MKSVPVSEGKILSLVDLLDSTRRVLKKYQIKLRTKRRLNKAP
jgi:hypothetical protein